MYSRRNFVKTMAVGVAGLYGTNALATSLYLNGNKLENIGYIAGILGRDLNEKDWKSMLRKTTNFGYTELEIGNYLGESANSFLSFCRDIGLKPIAGGLNFTEDTDTLNESFDKLNALEVKYAISYWPWYSSAPFGLEDCKRSADTLNKIGEMSKSHGLTLCWHNHDNEFVAMQEGLPFDYLMNNTDADLVKCELDIYWAKKGGANPVEVLQQYPGRYPILHVKDMAPGEQQDFACPGEGIIDWTAVFAESHQQDIRHYFVERDNSHDGLGCLQLSAAYLKELTF